MFFENVEFFQNLKLFSDFLKIFDFHNFDSKNLEKSRKSWISLDFPLHFLANVKGNQAKSNFFEIFRDFRKFSEKNLKNHEKSKIFEKSNNFRHPFFAGNRFLPLRNAGNEVSRF